MESHLIAALHPHLNPSLFSENVYLCVVTNFCLQEAFQTINPSPITEISIIKYSFLLLLKKAFCTTSLYARPTLSTCFHEMEKNPKRIFAFKNKDKVSKK